MVMNKKHLEMKQKEKEERNLRLKKEADKLIRKKNRAQHTVYNTLKQ